MALATKPKMTKQSNAEFVKWFGPLLDALRDLGDSGRPREVYARIAKNLALPDNVLDETLKSGASRFQNQVAWARQYLVWDGLVDSSKRGTWTLTEAGRNTHLTNTEANCTVPCDYLPKRSYPLFLAREVLDALVAELEAASP